MRICPVAFGLPLTAPRGVSPARLLSLLYESCYAQRQPVDPRQCVRAMLAPATPPELARRLEDELNPLGPRLLGWLRRFRLSIQLIDKSLNGPQGLYVPHYRGVLLQPDHSQRTALHEMGHALDHSLGSMHRGSSIAPMLWHGFARERRGFVTEYASRGPVEYFAESFASWFFPESNRKLKKLDPGMHALVTAVVELSW